jgi:TrpR-related protein YerC/YecD
MEKISQQPDVQMFYRAIMKLQNSEECHMFFMDICTINEIQTISQRLEVARMLTEGLTYAQIEKVTGASTATISRIKRFVQYGTGGYGLVIQRIAEEDAKA